MRARWLVLMCLAACSGGNGVDPGDQPPNEVVAQAGRVLLDNQLPYEVETAYLNRVDVDLPRIVRSTVLAGQRQDVSGEVLPAALEVEFDLVVLVPSAQGFRLRRKALVQVDGDVLVRLLVAVGAELADLEIAVGPLD